MPKLNKNTAFSKLNLENILHSWLLLFVEAVAFFVSWYLNNGYFCFALICLISIVVLVFSDDGYLLAPLILFTLTSYKELPYFDSIPIYLYLQVGTIVLSLIGMYIKKSIIQKKFLHKIGSIGISFLCIILLCLVSCIFNQQTGDSKYALYAYSTVLIALAIYIMYFLLVNTVNEDKYHYLSKIFAFWSLTILGQIFTNYILLENKEVLTTLYDTGWGSKNVVSIALEISIPFIALLWTYDKKHVELLLLIILDAALILGSNSRGGILTFLILTPVLALILGRGRNKVETMKYSLLYFSFIALATIVLIVYIPFINESFVRMLDYGFSLSGREEIWDECLRYFNLDPLIGASPSCLFEMYEKFGFTDNLGIWLCHNTWLTLLASLGCFGVIFYAYNLIEQLFASFTTKNPTMTLSLIYFILVSLIHGLVDNTFFSITYMLPFILAYCPYEQTNMMNIKALKESLKQ